jgi:hypothetical protein
MPQLSAQLLCATAEDSELFDSGKSNGGPGRDRTDDLFHAMEARSQLRHRPTFVLFYSR